MEVANDGWCVFIWGIDINRSEFFCIVLFLVSSADSSHRRKLDRYQMPARKGLLAPQNTFLDTIATRFDGTRECNRMSFPLFRNSETCCLGIIRVISVDSFKISYVAIEMLYNLKKYIYMVSFPLLDAHLFDFTTVDEANTHPLYTAYAPNIIYVPTLSSLLICLEGLNRS